MFYLFIFAVIVAGLAALLALDVLRRPLLSNPLMALFRRALPPVSETERDALEAGTVSWEAELFSGRPRWERLLEQPAPSLTEEEQAFLNGPVEELCAMLDDWSITNEHQDLPPEVWDYLRNNGFFGMIIPKEFGGMGFSASAHSCVVMKVASRSLTAGVTVMVPNSLGPASLLLDYGTEEQKNYYLPRLAAGREIPCFALTGPEAGSDAAAMPDTGVVCYGASTGATPELGIRLNWEKRYITLGPVATLLGLAFRLYDPDHLLGDREDLGITLALIPTDTPGVEIGERHFPLNAAFQNGPNRGRDVFIPLSRVIGEQRGVGRGWRMLMECLADGRGISLPALSTGAGKLASRVTGAYAAVRRQFKLPIGRFEGVTEALGRIAAHTYAMDAARTYTAGLLDRGEKPAVASAIIKYHLTERMRRVINDAMDIHGGSGICLGPRNFLGRIYQSIPISITVEGANILTRSLIIFGQGAVRCHPHLYAEMRAAADGDLADFDTHLWAHVRHVLSNGARSLGHGLTGGRLQRSPVSGPTAVYFRRFARLSTGFAFAADCIMLRLGGQLKRRESLSARLGDILSLLYLGTTTLKQHRDNGSPPEDLPLVQWVCEDAIGTIHARFDALLKNLPSPWLGWFLKRVIFPWGVEISQPGDALTRAAAAVISAPSPARDRLTRGIYLPLNAEEPLARLDQALVANHGAAAMEKRLRDAMADGRLETGSPESRIDEACEAGVISEHEAALYRAALLARREVVTVDAFAPDRFGSQGKSWSTQDSSQGLAGRSS